MTNHVEALVKRGVLEVTKNLVTSEIPTNRGVQQTTLYDLKVFNYLVHKLKLTKDELDTLTSSEGIKCSVDSRVQSLNLVSESGLYDLIMQSRKPEAKAFKRWVTHEVLPSICKTDRRMVWNVQNDFVEMVRKNRKSA